MLTKTKIALAAALVLGPASAALAADNEQSYGGPTQTWQDIERSAQYIQDQIKSEYHTGSAGAAYGYVKPAKPAHRAETSQDK
jgi:opacity protein-like surface antigen